MERRWQALVAVTVVALAFTDIAVSFSIRNEESGQCLTMFKLRERNRLELADCQSGSASQEWLWDRERCALMSIETEECISAAGTTPKQVVRLQSCFGREDGGEGQAWSCSKKGHLSLQGSRLHLSSRPGHDQPSKSKSLYLSKDRGPASQWRTLSNSSVCVVGGSGFCHKRQHSAQHHPTVAPPTSSQTVNRNKAGVNPVPLYNSGLLDMGLVAFGPPDDNTTTDLPTSSVDNSSFPPQTGAVDFFNFDFGISWKIAMLVLSSLALVLGFAILILSILQNRKKNVVVLKSYTRTGEGSLPGSPLLHDRAPLTKNPTRPAAQSPSLPRGEILVAWKDGSITPLFDTHYLGE